MQPSAPNKIEFVFKILGTAKGTLKLGHGFWWSIKIDDKFFTDTEKCDLADSEYLFAEHFPEAVELAVTDGKARYDPVYLESIALQLEYSNRLFTVSLVEISGYTKYASFNVSTEIFLRALEAAFKALPVSFDSEDLNTLCAAGLSRIQSIKLRIGIRQ